MSGKITGLVLEYYDATPGERMLAICLADHAKQDGTSIFPSVATMARITRQKERTVQVHLASMRGKGWLQLVAKPRGGGRGGGPGRPAEYRINPQWIKDALLRDAKAVQERYAEPAPISGKGVQAHQEMGAEAHAQMGAEAAAPEPSGTIKEEQHTGVWQVNQFTKRTREAAFAWVAPAAQALRDAGLADVPEYSQQVEILLDKGVTIEQFAEAGAIAARACKGFAYAIGVVKTKMREARRLRDMAVISEALAWDQKRSTIEAKGIEFGLAKWDETSFNTGRGENFLQYTDRVRRAMLDAGHKP